MAFFIPWRVVAEESGAAHFDLLGAPAAPAPIFILVLHRALPDLQRMKRCYSVAASSAPRSLSAWCN